MWRVLLSGLVLLAACGEGSINAGVDGGGDGGRFDAGDACEGVACPPGTTCVAGSCRAGDPCAGVVCDGASEVCSGGLCVPANTDDDGDGVIASVDCDDHDRSVVHGSTRPCSNACGEGIMTCGDDGAWSDCVVSGCVVPHGRGECVEGQCVVAACDEGWGDCDGRADNGCEAEPSWSELEGGDHCRADWSPADGVVIGGEHRNVGAFRVVEGATVRVQPFDGATGGQVTVEARTIEVAGTIDATGAGYAGGRGGDGQDSGDPYCGGDGRDGERGGGDAGGAGGGGGDGNGGDHWDDSGCRGADGDGGGRGGAGGYAGPGVNGDDSTDDRILMGSGGGGGGGGGSGSRYGGNNNFPGGTGGGGGAGGRGGGAVRLEAEAELTVTGTIRARGTRDGGDGRDGERLDPCDCRYCDPSGGRGGDPSGSGSSDGGSGARQDELCEGRGQTNTRGGGGGDGGPGGGGGVLLMARTVDIAGGIDLRGGGDDGMTNAGTLKVFACDSTSVDPRVGRSYVGEREGCE